MNKNENSFLDPKTILAVVLVAGVWFGWQNYLGKKYPQMNAAKPAAATTTAVVTPGGAAEAPNAASPAGDAALNQEPSRDQESLKKIESPQASFELSSYGMGIKNLKLNSYSRRDGSKFDFASGLSQGLFELHLLDDPKPINFTITDQGNNVFSGSAQVGSTKILRTITYSPETYSFKNTVTVLNPSASFRGLSLVIPEKKDLAPTSGSFLGGNYDRQEFLVAHDGNKTDTTNVTSAKENIEKTQGQVSILSLSAQYFASAVIDKSDIVPEAHLLAKTGEQNFQGQLSYKVGSPKDKMEFNFIAYSGPKSHEILEKVDPELSSIIDLGFFGPIGKVLLTILKWFNSFLGNWGLSIIALTLLVRGIVMPINITSYKSMKKMQKIQPGLKALRERYKDDPQTQQRETMALMKTEKVNPIAGCLPMFLQIPIFFALFRMLGQSIDLYQAPFIWWIHDLSVKDPFYVLPILVGITFFVQQKVTPTTMDPAQAKIMQWMPIMFAFFMISLPSGLTLYTFVSTLFGILQQRFFMRDRGAVISAREAKA